MPAALTGRFGGSEVFWGFRGIFVDYLIATAMTIRRLDNGDVRR